MRILVRSPPGKTFLLALAFISVGATQDGHAQGNDRLVDAVKERDTAAIDRLLAAGVDVDEPAADGATALAWAAHWDDLETARRLIAAGASVNAGNDYGVTPLTLACVNRNIEMVTLLLAAGADPNAAQVKGETPLMTAARTGLLGIVQRLLAVGADPNTVTGAAQQTALMWAAVGGHADVVRELLDAGADPEARTADGFSALLFAAREGSVEAARLLLERGVDVNELDSNGHSALAIATASGREGVALALLERGADPYLTDTGYTPLHLAVPKNQVAVARALLEHGADPNARLAQAPGNLFGRGNGAGTQVRPEVEESASDRPAPPRRGGWSNAGATPFFLAAKFVNTPMLEVLLAGGADPDVTTEGGTTPLMAAAGLTQVQGPPARRGEIARFKTPWNNPDSFEAVTYLLGLGADVNAVNKAGQTALQGAAYMGAEEVVELLVEHGADLDAQDAEGQTAYRVAEAHVNVASQGISSWPETAALLQRLGADTTLGMDGRVMLRDIVRRAGEQLRENER